MMIMKQMLEALQLKRKNTGTKQLKTIWGEQIDKEHVLEEYPRPQMVRDNYTILNGIYQYAFTGSSEMPSCYDGEILVPFSPETEMSGVGRQLQPNEYLWYERSFLLEQLPKGKRLLLHFGACDERCRVYINGEQVGTHAGGYQAFYFDITAFIKEGENKLQVCVKDVSDTSYHGRGKQKLKNGGMFYTAQSGIWQTVWYEWVPEIYVQSMHIIPHFDEDSVEIELFTNEEGKFLPYKVYIFDRGHLISEMSIEDGHKMMLPIPNKKAWSPVSPFLYDVTIMYGEDFIQSYFGMRHFSVEKDSNGILRLCLNHVPYFQNGILDHGYWPESLLTPISDEAMIYDIQEAKNQGFNMIRKHCKIEPMRWYYHCDRLGMLVWQDMINGGVEYNPFKTTYIPTVIRKLQQLKDSHHVFHGRANAKGRKEWKKECIETIEQLYNCTSICTWVLFNEGWGQFDAEENTQMVLEKDNTRIIDSHSGWFDQGAGDMRSVHIYFFELAVEKGLNKPFVISEYGGLAYGVKEHSYSEDIYGYANYENATDYKKAYKEMMDKIQKLKREGLAAAVYTQLADVEEEVNGILTYDRKISKLD